MGLGRPRRLAPWPLLAPIAPMAVVAWWVSASEPERIGKLSGPSELEYVAGLPTPNAEPSMDELTAAVLPWLSAQNRTPEGVQERFFGDRSKRWVALTFDDGPSRENTPRILDVLRKHRVHATFFVLGIRAKTMPDLVRDIAAAGHEVGNHSWSHRSFRSLWQSQIRSELSRTNDAIAAATGHRPGLVRPPYGRYPPSALSVFEEFDMHTILWSVDGHDWTSDDPHRVARRVVRGARPGSIVLLHDRESVTVHALPEIIEGLRARGFEIVPVSMITGLPAYADREPVSNARVADGASVIMASTAVRTAADTERGVSQR